LPSLLYMPLLGRRETLVAGLLQATSLPFLVATTSIGLELGLLGAGEAAALVGAGLLSVLLFPAAGLALLQRAVTNPGGPGPHAMHTTCSSHTTEVEAHAVVERLLEEGMPGTRIRVLSGRPEHDHREDADGSFAGAAGPVGAFAGAAGATADAMGAFAGAGRERRGGFGDADRDEVAEYRDGVRRVHVASHRELERLLADAGLGAEAIAKDVAALHRGRVLVLVTAT
jgi:hypothetical protein